MRHTVFWIVVIAAGVLVCGALAAPVVLTSAKVGGGNTSVVACDTDGLTQSYTTSRGNVTAVVVGGIADPACEGGTIRATVKSSSDSSIAIAGPQTVPTDGDTADNTVTLSTSPQPAASQVAGIDIVIEGP